MEECDISYDEIPAEFKNCICEKLTNTIIGLISVNIDNDNDFNFIGSGTLISYRNHEGILTAGHVARELENKNLGVVISRHRHKIIIKGNYLNIAKKYCQAGGEGPDISFIEIPSNILGDIKARKVFYNIDSRINEVISKPEQLRQGLWLVAGFPDEFRIQDPAPGEGFNGATGLEILYLKLGMPILVSDICDVDVYKFEVTTDQSQRIPANFGGVSGGGLWRVPLIIKNDNYEGPTPLLYGVAFSQGPENNRCRTLLFNGPKIVYGLLSDEVASR